MYHRGYNWKRNGYGLGWLKLIELQKDNWKIKYDWLWVPPFFCTFLWWLHHGITALFGGRPPGKTFATSRWDQAPGMGIRSCLREATFTMFGGGHSFLLCAIAPPIFGLVGSAYCLMFYVVRASNLKWEMTNMKPWEVGGDPWRPNLRRVFPRILVTVQGDHRHLGLGVRSSVQNQKTSTLFEVEWINYICTINLWTYTNRVWSIILQSSPIHICIYIYIIKYHPHAKIWWNIIHCSGFQHEFSLGIHLVILMPPGERLSVGAWESEACEGDDSDRLSSDQKILGCLRNFRGLYYPVI